MYELSIDSSDFPETINVLKKLAKKGDDWTNELFDIGIIFLRSQDLNFADEGRPPWDHKSQAAIDRQGMTLQDTGRLRRSIMVTESTKNSLTIGTEVEYGKYLQEEWPFLMIQPEDVEMALDIIKRSIEDTYFG